MRIFIILVALSAAACIFKPSFQMQPYELQNMAHPVVWARLADNRTINNKGAFVFVHDGRESPLVYTSSVQLGREGVCFGSSYPIYGFWRALHLDLVDARIATRVMQPRAGVKLQRVAEQSWVVTGGGDALRGWLQKHLGAVDDAHRHFVDLPAISYATDTVRNRQTWSEEDLRELVKPRGLLDDVPPSKVLVGWRWEEIERIDYHVIWPDTVPSSREITAAIRENDMRVRRAIDKQLGLPPGPCPLAEPQPLMIE